MASVRGAIAAGEAPMHPDDPMCRARPEALATPSGAGVDEEAEAGCEELARLVIDI
jgi:hypothetical protein